VLFDDLLPAPGAGAPSAASVELLAMSLKWAALDDSPDFIWAGRLARSHRDLSALIHRTTPAVAGLAGNAAVAAVIVL